MVQDMGTVSIREVTLGLCVRSATVECTLTWLTPHQARWQNMNVFSEGETYRKEGEFKIRGRETDRVNGRGLGLPWSARLYDCQFVRPSVSLSVILLLARAAAAATPSFFLPMSRVPTTAGRAGVLPTSHPNKTAAANCPAALRSFDFVKALRSMDVG